jgi:hypothetical protein
MRKTLFFLLLFLFAGFALSQNGVVGPPIAHTKKLVANPAAVLPPGRTLVAVFTAWPSLAQEMESDWQEKWAGIPLGTTLVEAPTAWPSTDHPFFSRAVLRFPAP